MLKIIKRFDELDLSQLILLHSQSLEESGHENYPDLPENLQMIQAEQDLYAYLKLFFEDAMSAYAIWAPDGRYKAALRLERYNDGLIITGLETSPDVRREGYGSALVNAAVEYAAGQGVKKLYAHIDKRNSASLRLHEKCGFQRCLDYAIYLDGSVLTSSYTYSVNLEK